MNNLRNTITGALIGALAVVAVTSVTKTIGIRAPAYDKVSEYSLKYNLTLTDTVSKLVYAYNPTIYTEYEDMVRIGFSARGEFWIWAFLGGFKPEEYKLFMNGVEMTDSKSRKVGTLDNTELPETFEILFTAFDLDNRLLASKSLMIFNQ